MIGGDTLCFSDTSTPDDQSDVIDSTLLSELAANANTSSSYSAGAWWTFYSSVMSNIAWIMSSFSSFNLPLYPYRVNTTQSYLHEIGQAAIHEIVQHIKSSIYNEKLTRLFDALNKAGAGSKELTLFAQSHSKVRKDLILVGISDHGQGNPALVLLALEISSIDLSDASKLLSPATQFDYKVATLDAQLSTDVFNTFKKQIEQKLGDYIKSEVLPVGQ